MSKPICANCGLELTDTGGTDNGYGRWWSNHDLIRKDGDPEPWLNACPGSREILARYPTYDSWWPEHMDADNGHHVPVDPLTRLVMDYGTTT